MKSLPSRSPARRIASRFLTWVTSSASHVSAIARACDQPTSGTLVNSGLAASAMSRARMGHLATETSPYISRALGPASAVGVSSVRSKTRRPVRCRARRAAASAGDRRRARCPRSAACRRRARRGSARRSGSDGRSSRVRAAWSCSKRAALLDRVGELAEAVAELDAVDVGLEALGEARVVRAQPRERGHARRVVGQERRLAATRAAARSRSTSVRKNASSSCEQRRRCRAPA